MVGLNSINSMLWEEQGQPSSDLLGVKSQVKKKFGQAEAATAKGPTITKMTTPNKTASKQAVTQVTQKGAVPLSTQAAQKETAAAKSVIATQKKQFEMEDIANKMDTLMESMAKGTPEQIMSAEGAAAIKKYIPGADVERVQKVLIVRKQAEAELGKLPMGTTLSDGDKERLAKLGIKNPDKYMNFWGGLGKAWMDAAKSSATSMGEAAVASGVNSPFAAMGRASMETKALEAEKRKQADALELVKIKGDESEELQKAKAELAKEIQSMKDATSADTNASRERIAELTSIVKYLMGRERNATAIYVNTQDNNTDEKLADKKNKPNYIAMRDKFLKRKEYQTAHTNTVELSKAEALGKTAATNKAAAGAFQTSVAKLFEKGVLTNQDIDRYKGDQSIKGRLTRWAQKNFSGTLPPEDLAALREIVSGMKGVYTKEKRDLITQELDSASADGTISRDEYKKHLSPYVPGYESPATKGGAPKPGKKAKPTAEQATAIDWAKKNPNNPKAKEILTLMKQKGVL